MNSKNLIISIITIFNKKHKIQKARTHIGDEKQIATIKTNGFLGYFRKTFLMWIYVPLYEGLQGKVMQLPKTIEVRIV